MVKDRRVIGAHSVGKIRKVQVVRYLGNELAERRHSRRKVGMAMRVLVQHLFDVLSFGGGAALEANGKALEPRELHFAGVKKLFCNTDYGRGIQAATQV